MIFLDTETCGLHGMPVIIQYAVDDGPIQIHNFWKVPIYKSLQLIEWICSQEVCGFNLAFDWFHLNKIYNVFNNYIDPNEIPEYAIKELADIEKESRDGKCLKPKAACDILLLARKTNYQSTMDRHPIRIKRVPTQLAYKLAENLEKGIQLKELYFARRADKDLPKWKVEDLKDPDPNFRNVVLRFAPSAALKVLVVDALGLDPKEVTLFSDIGVDKRFYPEELGYAPFAEAVEPNKIWKKTWPAVIEHHIDHWQHNEKARKYAGADVEYTRRMYEFFGSPEPGDDDSELACMVASVRWKGFKVNIDQIKKLRAGLLDLIASTPIAPNRVKDFIWPHLSDDEKLITEGSTKRVILEKMEKWRNACPDCEGEGCDQCDKGLVIPEAAKRAAQVLKARKAAKEIELYDKLILAGRFHASFKVIGTLSSRMSGSDGLNPQGIKSTKQVRKCFPLAFDNEKLCGGDFESFEVTIAEAIYNDPKLRRDITTIIDCYDCGMTGKDKKDPNKICGECGGTLRTTQKIHGLFAMKMYPGKTYKEIIESKGTALDMYTNGKKGVFLKIYGGNANTMVDRIGIDLETAEKADKDFNVEYQGVFKAQKQVYDNFCSMRQPGGIGSKVIWNDPAEYMESLTGFRRYFTIENEICKYLYNLANDPPKEWQGIQIKVIRRDREQNVSGAIRSAIFAAAFNIQSSSMRAAGNHRIQSTGAIITKRTQRRIWDIQPHGIHNWVVRPMNIHDEIMVVTSDDQLQRIEDDVKEVVNGYKEIVPLISIDWSQKLNTWADK